MNDSEVKFVKNIDLIKIPSIEFPGGYKTIQNINKENMEYLNKYFKCESKYHHWKEINGAPLPGSSEYLAARVSVVKRLIKAKKMLPEGLFLKIYDAYRPIAIQQALWDYYREEKIKENPSLNDDEINRITSYCVSFPSYDILKPSLHNTGGAVDLTIINKDGIELNMGCDFDEFSPKAWTDYYEKNDIDGEVRENRRLLYSVMIEAGFTNLPSEWWHYDYGDNAWAHITGLDPIYTGILDAGVNKSEDYKNIDEIRRIDNMQQQKIHQKIEID